MKKRIICICLVLAAFFSLCSPAYAEPRYNSTDSCSTSLTIKNAVATCKLNVIAQNTSDKITATIKLKNVNGIVVKTWNNVTGTGDIYFRDTYTVVRNNTYELIATVTVSGVNGTDYITKTVTANS